MKNVFLHSAVLLTCLSFVFVIQAKEERVDKNSVVTNVLMLGLDDNVSSNYFPNSMIAEETGITEDVIDQEYNTVIMDNIMTSNKKSCKFIPFGENVSTEKWSGLIKVNGEGDESYSDVSSVPSDKYQKALDIAGAEYLLVLNQHYLKWQEKPMCTLFHIVSYTLFDKDKNEVHRGNGYFASMYLEHPDKIRKASNKMSTRIATTITNLINKMK